MSDTVLTIKQAAELLQVKEPTVRRLARDGDLPASKVGREWRFFHVDLINHIRAQYQTKNTESERPLCSTNAKIQRSTGSKSQSTVDAYNDLLKLPTNAKRKSSTTH